MILFRPDDVDDCPGIRCPMECGWDIQFTNPDDLAGPVVALREHLESHSADEMRLTLDIVVSGGVLAAGMRGDL